jgi:hypothetical protein
MADIAELREISRLLAARIDELVLELLPAGRREGHEWRVGSVAGEPGHSLGIHLMGEKAGIWADFAGDESGDAFALVRAVLRLGTEEARTWSRCWLGLEAGVLDRSPRPTRPFETQAMPDPNRWRLPWKQARPISGSLAVAYLRGRGLDFIDPSGRVLRFSAQRARRNADGALEHHPAVLAALSDVRTGQQVGIINIYLRSDGGDRLRDRKGKTVTGRPKGAAVMLSTFDEPTSGLTICEGTETGIAILAKELAPVWACGGAVFLRSFPVLAGIECLTIAADPDATGQRAAEAVATRWRKAGRETAIIAPPAGDWADPRSAHA